MDSESLAQTSIWQRLPNETASKSRRSPTRSDLSQSPSHPPAFDPSPRSSISSFSATPSSSAASPAHPPAVSLPPGLFLDSTTTSNTSSPKQHGSQQRSPQSPSALGLYPEPPSTTFSSSNHAFRPSSTTREGSTQRNSFVSGTTSTSSSATATPSSIQASGVPTAALLSPPLPSESDNDSHTQLALAEIFGGQVRPHYRSPSFASSPRPEILSPPETSRSYFSPPLPTPKSPAVTVLPGRPRSQSSAPALDSSFRANPGNTMQQQHSQQQQNGVYGQQQNEPADQYGYRPTTTATSNALSSSFPASSANPIRIGGDNNSPSSPSRPRLGQFGGGSYTSGISGATAAASAAATGYDATSGWRAAGTGMRQAASFGQWEDAEREGRSRVRGSEPWGGSMDGEPSSGIGLSNMSPFTRDGGRVLGAAPPGHHVGSVGAAGDYGAAGNDYKSRRDYSLGAVGSGRKRGDSVWGRERPLKEAHNEDEDDDAFAPPTRSGATSRRHSFAAFNPASRSQIGFDLPSEGKPTTTATSSVSTSGFGAFSPISTSSAAFNGGRFGGGGGGNSTINDDDLAADLNSLQLNLEAHVAATSNGGRSSTQAPPSLVGSMPTHFPRSPSDNSRRFDDSSSPSHSHSRSPPPPPSLPTTSRALPPPSSTVSSSTLPTRSFFPQPPTTTTSLSASTARSRFEFGGLGGGIGGSGFGGGGGGNDFGFGAFGSNNKSPPLSQQQAPARYMPSFGLPPPSPPNSFYASGPLSPNQSQHQHQQQHGFNNQQGHLSANAPSFSGFTSPPIPPPALHHNYFSPQPPQPRQQPQQQQQSQHDPQQQNDLVNLGRGVPLHTVPANAPLYIVEFKAGRKDLFFVEDPNLVLRQGDLVIVEADRGKDVGKYFGPCSLDEVQAFQQRLVELALGQLANPTGSGGGPATASSQPPNAAALARMTKEFQPKRLYAKASPADTHMLLSKAQDEVKALALVRNKVAQKNLPMEVCDAEWQWDRRKLTFYYTSDARVDFRELVRELFRVYKTRVWMCCLDQQSSAWDFK